MARAVRFFFACGALLHHFSEGIERAQRENLPDFRLMRVDYLLWKVLKKRSKYGGTCRSLFRITWSHLTLREVLYGLAENLKKTDIDRKSFVTFLKINIF